MPHATVADVRALAPEFGADDSDGLVLDATISTWLRIAQHFIDLGRWGEQAQDGHALLTAHLVAVAPDGGDAGAGPVSGASVGPVSTSYAVAPPVDELLSSTVYGRAYMALRQVVASTGTGVLSTTLVRLG